MDLRQTITKLNGKRGSDTQQEARSRDHDRQGEITLDSGSDSAFCSPKVRDHRPVQHAATKSATLPVRNSLNGPSKRPRMEPRPLFPGTNESENEVLRAIRAVQTSVDTLKKKVDQEKAEIEALDKELARKKESYCKLGEALHRAKDKMEQISNSIMLETPAIQQVCSDVTSPSVPVAPRHAQPATATTVLVKRERGL